MAFRSILVPFDGSPPAMKALAAALQLARDGQGCVRLLHLVDDLAYLRGREPAFVVRDDLRRYAQRVLDIGAAECRAASVPYEVLLVDGARRRLGEVVAEQAADWPADLVAIGSHGRRGLSRLVLGSDAEQVIRLCPVPVLTVR